ncbi:MAG TPA: DUF488 domain-containing protein [Chryseosolibacter sp.]|nr:DUF488 domain-containing protein [Chryseosolibacter sp.]
MALLNNFSIKTLVDIRTYPGSRRYPHFNSEHFRRALAEKDIAYYHLPELGGRRKPLPDSPNTAWRNSSFRGYADHMQSDEFKKGIEVLQQLAMTSPTAYMCSESLWWKCHRALVSDYLKNAGWRVYHIQNIGKYQEHPFTSPARAVQGNLFYS